MAMPIGLWLCSLWSPKLESAEVLFTKELSCLGPLQHEGGDHPAWPLPVPSNPGRDLQCCGKCVV